MGEHEEFSSVKFYQLSCVFLRLFVCLQGKQRSCIFALLELGESCLVQAILASSMTTGVLFR
jgi:hypothetical protein